MVNKEKINTAKEIYSKLKKWNLANQTLRNYFNENKSNKSKEIILVKVLIINGLYKTNLRNQISVAENILKINHLDNLLEGGDIKAVEEIANWEKNILSFASKFCHFSNPKEYPIYDSYVVIALKKLIKYKDTRKYEDFKRAITNLIHESKLESVNFEDIDKYLWLFGLRERLSQGREDINKEVKELYKKERVLFDRL